MSFLYPYFLFFLALPLALAVAAFVLHVRRGAAWRSLVSAAHPELVVDTAPWQKVLPMLAVLGALVLGILALARPVAGFSEASAHASGRNLFIALDVSRSMTTDDVSPSRLEQARSAALELLDALPGDKIGLIVFAGEADVVVPLTYDHNTLRDILQRVDTGWAGYGGTNFGLVLTRALDNFRRSAPGGGNALVIFSDGEDTVNSNDAAAKEALKEGMHVITVGVGTPGGAPIPDPSADGGLWRDASGKHVISKLNAESLIRFAKETGGRYFAAGAGADISQFARVAAEDLKKHEEEVSLNRVPKDVFVYFAVPALLLLLLGMVVGSHWRLPRRVAAAVALLCLLPVTEAAEPERVQDYEQALKQKDPAAAKESFSKALLSDDPHLQAAARLGMANIDTEQSFETLRKLYEQDPEQSQHRPGVDELTKLSADLKKNIAAYDDVLKLDADCSAAVGNKGAVEKLLRKVEKEIERLRQEEKKQQQDKQDQKDQENQQDKQDQKDQKDQQDKQDQKDRENQQDKQDQKDRKDQQDKQDQKDRKDQQDKQDQKDQKDQQDKQDQKDQKDQQDKQDQKDRKNQQDKQDQKDRKDQQDKQDQKDRKDQQDKQDPKNKQGQQDKQEKKDQKDKQKQPEPREPKQQPANPNQDADKEKQRAFSTLQIHADEETGSPIMAPYRPRPPKKDY